MPRSSPAQPPQSTATVDILADRIRAALPSKGRSEQRMFGGIGFMLNGNMIGGSSKHGLLLRVGKEAYADAVRRPGARPMDMRGKPIEGYIYVDPQRLDDAALRDWLQLALAFVRTLPPKAEAKKAAPKKGERK